MKQVLTNEQKSNKVCSITFDDVTEIIKVNNQSQFNVWRIIWQRCRLATST